LRAFEAVARSGSFRGAAAALNVTPSAISHQIRTLEDLLQVSLFDRTTRRVRLTASGEAYLPAVREGLDILGAATEAVTRRPWPRRLTVSAAPSFAVGWLMPRLPRLQLIHPTLEVRLAPTPEVVDLRASDVDVAIRYTTRPVFRGLTAHRLFGEPLTAVCSPALVAAGLRRVEDLAQARVIQTPHRQGHWKTWLTAAGCPDLRPQDELWVEVDTIAIEAALDSLGVALLADHLARRYIEDGRLVAPFAHVVDSTGAYYLLYPPEREDDPVVALFRDWLLGLLA
jgi:LysR family glycine cleavage system transcriptional activator